MGLLLLGLVVVVVRPLLLKSCFFPHISHDEPLSSTIWRLLRKNHSDCCCCKALRRLQWIPKLDWSMKLFFKSCAMLIVKWSVMFFFVRHRSSQCSRKCGVSWFVCCPGKVSTVKLHKRGPLLQAAGHPFPLLLGQPSSALLSTAQAGGPPSVEIGWATKTITYFLGC